MSIGESGPSFEIPGAPDETQALGLSLILVLLEDPKQVEQAVLPLLMLLSQVRSWMPIPGVQSLLIASVFICGQVSRHTYLPRNRSLRALLLFNTLGMLSRNPYFSAQGQVFDKIFQGITAEVLAFVRESLEVVFRRQGMRSVADSCGSNWERVLDIVRVQCDTLQELVAHWGNSR